jgi:uncharacterized membrane protein
VGGAPGGDDGYACQQRKHDPWPVSDHFPTIATEAREFGQDGDQSTGPKTYSAKRVHPAAVSLSTWLLVLSVFLACAVEGVEALTIVLAVGTTRDWRSALTGVGAGVVVLAAIVAVLGPTVTAIPIGALRVVVGGVLLIFGLQWLRKAILRASGLKALHDEDAIYARQVIAAHEAPAGGRLSVPDWYAFTLSFKGVLLEGLEVVFIVLTFGANQHSIGWAVIGAVAAILAVVLGGIAVRGPLARVPENTMKFVVGVMLTSFGMFWGAEGAGARWPGSDAAIPVLIAATAAVSLALVAILRRTETAAA